jgi:hypothetical protein
LKNAKNIWKVIKNKLKAKTYLELHFFAKKKDVVAFRLLLEEIIQNDIDIFFMNQVLMLDNECEEDLLLKKKEKIQTR